MPVFWTAGPSRWRSSTRLNNGVDWPWFIASQFIFGVVAALVVIDLVGRVPAAVAGVIGGVFGGLLMPIPALCGAWPPATGFGIRPTCSPAWCGKGWIV